MKSAIIAAVVAALVASGGTYAATSISGRQIRNHSISAWKLTPQAIASLRGQQGPIGPAGPQGDVGPQGVAGETPKFATVYLCIAADNSVTWGGLVSPWFTSSCPAGDSLVRILAPDTSRIHF